LKLRSFKSYQTRRQTTFLWALLATATSAGATTVTTFTSAGQLAPNVTAFSPISANVNSTGAPATVGSVYSSSSVSFTVLNTTSNNKLTFSGAANGFEVDQVGANYGDSAFSNGTVLLAAGGFQGSAGGPVTITFAAPVSQFGVNIEDFNSGNYNVNFTAYDASGTEVAFVTAAEDPSLNGNDPSSLSFAGLYVTGDSIKTIVVDDVINYSSGTNVGSDNLLLGNLEYLNATTPVGQQTNPTPEPSALVLVALGLLFTATAGRRCLTRR